MNLEKQKIKQRLLSEALRMQKFAVDQLRDTVVEAQQSANDNEDDTEEKLFNSYREEMQNKRDMFARQLDQALDDQALLLKVNANQENKEVGFGACVLSGSQKLFIGSSLGRISLDGDTWFAISPLAPLYKAMVGKKTGDTYEFRGEKATIKEVF